MGAVNYWSKRLNRGQVPLWLQRGCRGERQRPGKLFVPSGDRGAAEKERGGTAADRKAQLVVRAWGFGGPYGRQQFFLRFIAHLAVLINGKPVHRAWSFSGCFPSSCCYPNLSCSTTYYQVSKERRSSSRVSLEIFALCYKAESVYSVMVLWLLPVLS